MKYPLLILALGLILFCSALHSQSKTQNSKSYFEKAFRFEEEGKYKKAVLNAQLAILQRSSTAAYITCGMSNRQLGYYWNALYCMNEAVEESPHSHYGYLNRGSLYGELGYADLSIADLNKALDLKDDYKHAHNNLGAVYTDTGEFDKALFHLQKTIEMDSTFHHAYITLTKLYLLKNKLDSAQYHAKKVLDMNATNGLAYLRLAEIGQKQGKPTEIAKYAQLAVESISRAVKKNDREYTGYMNRAKAYQLLNKNEEAQKQSTNRHRSLPQKRKPMDMGKKAGERNRS